MCGRYRLSPRKQIIEAHFETADWQDDWSPRYNIAPTQSVPVIRQHPKEPIRQLSSMKWGLIPNWARDISIASSTINAKSETAAIKPAFRDPLKFRRCLIPADGFYEWKRTGASKQPYCFEVNAGELFAFAGLWDGWKNAEGQWIKTCSILTTTPNAVTSAIHDRMPVIVHPDSYDLWLDSGMNDVQALSELLKPYDARLMRSYPVSTRIKGDHIVAVGNTEEEHAEMKALTDVLAPAAKERDVPPLVNGADIEGEMKAEISEKYVRAIAKVGFHYFLKYFPNFSGMEPEFAEIKTFIYHGNANRQIVRIVDEPFLRDLQQRGAVLTKWCHSLSAESTDRGIEARIQFFAGPEVQPLVWSIVISTKPSAHIQYTGHAFVYFDDVTEEYLGQRADLIVAPISLEQDIRLRAYSLYVQRGRRNGFALDDWLEAEAEILGMLRQRAETLKPLS